MPPMRRLLLTGTSEGPRSSLSGIFMSIYAFLSGSKSWLFVNGREIELLFDALISVFLFYIIFSFLVSF